MLFEKVVTINLGNYESLKLGVSEAGSFKSCDIELEAELVRLELKSKGVRI